MRVSARLLCAGLLLATTEARACFLESGLGGELTTSDPLAIPVLVAAREAADRGKLMSIDVRDRDRLSRAVAVLGYVPMIVDGLRVDVTSIRFAVLQAQTGYWTRYTVADGVVRTEPHLKGPGEVDAVLVVADAALLETILGDRPLSKHREDGVLRARGRKGSQAVDSYLLILERFSDTPLAQRIREMPPEI
jgi:hypothetical protein